MGGKVEVNTRRREAEMSPVWHDQSTPKKQAEPMRQVTFFYAAGN